MEQSGKEGDKRVREGDVITVAEVRVTWGHEPRNAGDPHTALKSGPHSPQLEKALTQKRGPNTAKNKFKKKSIYIKKKCRRPLDAGKGEETGSSPELSEGHSPADTTLVAK